MPTQGLYGHFRKRIEDLADSSQPQGVCLAKLRDVLRQFDAEVAALDSANANLLREELCQQLELEVLRATRGQRCDVLVAALKHFELNLN